MHNECRNAVRTHIVRVCVLLITPFRPSTLYDKMMHDCAVICCLPGDEMPLGLR